MAAQSILVSLVVVEHQLQFQLMHQQILMRVTSGGIVTLVRWQCIMMTLTHHNGFRYLMLDQLVHKVTQVLQELTCNWCSRCYWICYSSRCSGCCWCSRCYWIGATGAKVQRVLLVLVLLVLVVLQVHHQVLRQYQIMQTIESLLVVVELIIKWRSKLNF